MRTLASALLSLGSDETRINGYRVEVEQDDDGANPRAEYDNLGTMVCWHGRYCLGDDVAKPSHGDYASWDELQAALVAEHDPAVILPLYLYDHSGLVMATTAFSCGWDSGQVGFIFISKEKARREYGVKRISPQLRARLATYLEGEVETYSQYLAGDVYGFRVVRERDDEEIDSCWGFFGDDHRASGLREHAFAVIDGDMQRRRRERIDKVKQWIKSGVGLAHRWQQLQA